MKSIYDTAYKEFLVCDFFKHLYKAEDKNKNDSYYQKILKKIPSLHNLKVFLCGQELTESQFRKHYDKRFRIQEFLNSRMGCRAFLGEEIEKFKKPIAVDEDFLSIEVSEAESSDLIFLFLESFGTVAELTAFVLNEKTIDKLVVFNDSKHFKSDKPSFLKGGPLKLLSLRNPQNLVPYDTANMEAGLSNEIISHLDGVVSRVWFKKCQEFSRIQPIWTYETFIVLVAIHAFFPITEEELETTLENRLSKEQIKAALSKLRKENRFHKRDKKFLEPADPIENLGLDNLFQADIARCRTTLIYQRLGHMDFDNNYRLLLEKRTRSRIRL